MLKSSTFKRIFCALGVLPALAAAQFNFDPADTSKVPKLLSGTGFYAGTGSLKTRKPIPAAFPFEVNSALWSDGAHKLRWILLKTGTSVTFRETDDYFDYPDGAVFVKQFAIDTIPGDTTSRRIWETRVLINKKVPYADTGTLMVDKWFGYSYQWNAAQTDAVLVSIEDGRDDTLRVYPTGKTGPSKMKKWHFPNTFQCNTCHRSEVSPDEKKLHGRSVLGFFTAQLNKAYPGNKGNQLDSLFAKGILKVAKPADKPANWNNSPKWFEVTDSLNTDPRDSIGARARAYIGANCSGCHGTRGMSAGATMGVTLNYDFHEIKPMFEFRDRWITFDYGLIDSLPVGREAALIVPGYPSKSLLLWRQQVPNDIPGDFFFPRPMMPPLARYEANQAAMNVIAKWISNMQPLAVIRPQARHILQSPAVQGRLLILPHGMAGPDTKVGMTDLSGRTQGLQKVGGGAYAIPQGLPGGIYIFRVGGQSFTRYVF